MLGPIVSADWLVHQFSVEQQSLQCLPRDSGIDLKQLGSLLN